MALDQKTLNKMILLKFTSLHPGLRKSMLAEIALDSLQMDFFSYSEATAELISGKLLYLAVRKDEPHLDADQQAVERIDITAKGLEVLNALQNQIPDNISKWIKRKSEELKGERLKLENHSFRLKPTATGEWLLTLERFENESKSFTISLVFPTENLAKKAASAWEAASFDLYETILKKLLKD